MGRGWGVVVAVAMGGCRSEQPVAPSSASPAVAIDGPSVDGGGPAGAEDSPTDASVDVASAPATAPTLAIPPFPTGAKVLAFREMLIGVLPATGRRVTWRLARAGSDAVLRIDSEISTRRLDKLDAQTLDDKEWRGPVTTAYVGAVERDAPLRMRLRLVVAPAKESGAARGRSAPDELVLECASKTVRAHRATARRERASRDQDSARARWVPSTTHAVPVTRCAVVGENPLLSYTEALAFAPARGEAADPTLEWSFINSDMVIQDGGYRLLPAASP